MFFLSSAARHDVRVLNPVTLMVVAHTVLHFKVITVIKTIILTALCELTLASVSDALSISAKIKEK